MTAMPAKYNITLRRGITNQNVKIYYFTDEGEVDLSALYDGARMQVRPSSYNIPTIPPPVEPPLYEFTTENGRLVFEDGGVAIKLTAVESSSLPFTSGVYDLELYSGSGVDEIVCTLLEGSIKTTGEVTV